MDLPPVKCSCGLDHKGSDYADLIHPVSGFLDLAKLGVRAEYVVICKQKEIKLQRLQPKLTNKQLIEKERKDIMKKKTQEYLKQFDRTVYEAKKKRTQNLQGAAYSVERPQMSYAAFADLPGHPTEEICSINQLMIEKDFELIRHEYTIKQRHIRIGKEKSANDTALTQRREMLNEASNFQDIGIRTRVTVQPPKYKDKYEFLHEEETSDEEAEAVAELAKGGYDSHYDRGEENARARAPSGDSYNQRDAVTTASTKAQSAVRPTGRVQHPQASAPQLERFRQFDASNDFHNLESQELLTRAKDQYKLPIDEEPELIKPFMHVRMANQVLYSLNKPQVAACVA